MDADAPRRMTLSRMVELLLERGSAAGSSVTLTRNAKGDTQIEVVVRTGDDDHPRTPEMAAGRARLIYDQLREQYPYPAIDGGETPAKPKPGGKSKRDHDPAPHK